MGVAPEHLELIRRALVDVVSTEDGTAFRSRNKGGVAVAGKTGTAQVVSRKSRSEESSSAWYLDRSHGWFAGFAPGRRSAGGLCGARRARRLGRSERRPDCDLRHAADLRRTRGSESPNGLGDGDREDHTRRFRLAALCRGVDHRAFRSAQPLQRDRRWDDVRRVHSAVLLADAWVRGGRHHRGHRLPPFRAVRMADLRAYAFWRWCWCSCSVAAFAVRPGGSRSAGFRFSRAS